MTVASIVIGIGNRYRRDDGSALFVLDALAGRVPPGTVVLESDGEPARLIKSWADAPIAVVIETVRGGSTPGSVSHITWEKDLAFSSGERNSHGLGVIEAVALGRAVGRMPRKLRLVGIEPEDLGWGEGLSDAVARSVSGAAELVLECLR